MNRYLDKIAEKIELEPGVNWDTDKKQIVIDRGRYATAVDNAGTINGLGGGFYGGVYGGMAGGLVGLRVGTRMSSKYNEPLTNRRALVGINPKTGLEKKYFSARQLASNTTRSSQVRLNAKFNQYRDAAILARKVSLGTGAGIGGLLGAAGAYALTKSTFKSSAPAVKDAKDALLTRLERKYEKQIDQIEGWD